MTTQPKKPSFNRMLLVTILGFSIGLFLGIAVAVFWTPGENIPVPITVNSTDRLGRIGTMTVTGETPAYMVFPVVGACAGFLWMLYLRSSREEE